MFIDVYCHAQIPNDATSKRKENVNILRKIKMYSLHSLFLIILSSRSHGMLSHQTGKEMKHCKSVVDIFFTCKSIRLISLIRVLTNSEN